MRFTFQFSHADTEAWEWLCLQPQRGAYLKALILADKGQCTSGKQSAPLKTNGTLFDVKWHAQYELLQDFVAEHGRFPSSVESYRGVNIGRWLNEQKRKNIPSSRCAMLEKLGALDGKWEQMYHLVAEFQKEFGRLPKKRDVYRDVRIGAWLTKQVKQYDILDPAYAKKLETIGALQSKWERNYIILLRFIKQHGRLPKYLDCYDQAQIGRWLNYQCKTLDPLRFPDRAQKLCRLGATLEKGTFVMKETPIHTESRTKHPTERCILCGKETDIPSDLPVDQRQWYIVGCGQLCTDCFEKIK